MAYDRQQLRVDWIFRILGTDEIGITGLSVSGAAGFNAPEALEQFDAAVDGAALITAMNSMLTAGRYSWADYSTLTDVKVAALGTNGLYLTEPKIHSPASPNTGTATNIVPQCSVVLSLRTSTQLGRANYGRMYMPHTMLALVNGTPVTSGTRTQGAADDSATFLNAVNTIFNTGSDPAQIQIMSSVGAGLSRAVSRCGVGSVNDTQRRRRNRLQEIYSFQTVVTA